VTALAAAMLLSGFMVAGPDSVLGGAACADVCEHAGYGSSVLTTASGIANGLGSVGAIMSGAVPVLIKDRYGWEGVFVSLTGLSVLGAAALVPWVRASSQGGAEEKRKKKK
jgi:sugar phosphate permease